MNDDDDDGVSLMFCRLNIYGVKITRPLNKKKTEIRACIHRICEWHLPPCYLINC